jgi:hypothetical protein
MSNYTVPNANTSVSSNEEPPVLYEWYPGEIIGGRYRVIRGLGAGAFGVVVEV